MKYNVYFGMFFLKNDERKDFPSYQRVLWYVLRTKGKYFKIYKNQLLVFLILCGVCLIANFYCEKTGITISDFPDITNSGVVIFAFLCLYILEKTSMFFAGLFNSVKGKNSIIENWINKINNFSFTLKVK